MKVKVRAGSILYLRFNNYLFDFKELKCGLICDVVYKLTDYEMYKIKVDNGIFDDYFFVRFEDCEEIK